MSRFDSATSAAVAFGAGILLVGALAGCTQIDDLLSRQHREEFPTRAEAAEGWVGVDLPSWIPADATALRNLATFDETVAVIRVVSDEPLAGDCAPGERRGIPSLAEEWTDLGWDENGFPDEVERCGDYEVVPTDDGWLGWFNATEPGQTPG
jgi:hypothetical protein